MLQVGTRMTHVRDFTLSTGILYTDVRDKSIRHKPLNVPSQSAITWCLDGFYLPAIYQYVSQTCHPEIKQRFNPSQPEA